MTRPLACVTGGARRVGRAIVLELARRGCDVVVHYMTSRGEAESCAAEARGMGVSAVVVRADLGTGSGVEMLAEAVQARGRLDVLVHSASVYGPTPTQTVTAEELVRQYRVNAVAPGVVAFPEAGYESGEAMQQAYLARVPLARSGTPEDAARAVAYLALDAGYVTGTVLRVDGGRWLG